ncbi:Crp/Fnr family transcriptional regulator [Piscinibacter sakaiensis]|uniref:cAMP-binding protein n=1 Tax=Piscinibacter sakaiensis TaxID=1547922 RepID=A0A0K8NZ90_PISS1|nr:Crp/Fnr family transcriptional regulator [Piscinibacter sakaiensis]GAP35240.1 cAMP-binding protein [Piscinibacter sakaiensis]
MTEDLTQATRLAEADTAPLLTVAFQGCLGCPLRPLPLFQSVDDEEQALIARLKQGEVLRAAGSVLLAEGEADGPLLTLLSGWAFRFKTLPDGRRQILNFLLPGDFIGLQKKLTDAATHGVEALTAVRLCTFRRDAVWTLHRERPSLGYDVTWLAAHEEALVDDNLLSVGRHSALERIASLLLQLHARARAHHPPSPCVGAGDADTGVPFPLTQQHLADALGLSLAHTNKTLRRLVRAGLCEWTPGVRLHLPDPAALAAHAGLEAPGLPPSRPLI